MENIKKLIDEKLGYFTIILSKESIAVHAGRGNSDKVIKELESILPDGCELCVNENDDAYVIIDKK